MAVLTRRELLGVTGLTAATLALGGAAGPGDVAARYRTVSEMLSAEPFSVAHRGCSRSWPEMSLYAYTQAARAGFGALELSLARTRDGVWFGLHDESLDRTSGVAGKTASELTWAEVQGYRILGSTAVDDPTQPDRPYMRWEEIIAAYYPSHVLFVDPKHALPHRAELMNKMNALPGTPQDHLVCKYYGVSGNADNTSGWARLAADFDYSRWGYFFGSDAAGFASYEGRWDLLGLDHGADDTLWRTMASFGKPIIGHIAANKAAVATALRKGASGVIVSAAAARLPGRRAASVSG